MHTSSKRGTDQQEGSTRTSLTRKDAFSWAVIALCMWQGGVCGPHSIIYHAGAADFMAELFQRRGTCGLVEPQVLSHIAWLLVTGVFSALLLGTILGSVRSSLRNKACLKVSHHLCCFFPHWRAWRPDSPLLCTLCRFLPPCQPGTKGTKEQHCNHSYQLRVRPLLTEWHRWETWESYSSSWADPEHQTKDIKSFSVQFSFSSCLSFHHSIHSVPLQQLFISTVLFSPIFFVFPQPSPSLCLILPRAANTSKLFFFLSPKCISPASQKKHGYARKLNPGHCSPLPLSYCSWTVNSLVTGQPRVPFLPSIAISSSRYACCCLNSSNYFISKQPSPFQGVKISKLLP